VIEIQTSLASNFIFEGYYGRLTSSLPFCAVILKSSFLVHGKVTAMQEKIFPDVQTFRLKPSQLIYYGCVYTYINTPPNT
jgi:hypothetical protein